MKENFEYPDADLRNYMVSWGVTDLPYQFILNQGTLQLYAVPAQVDLPRIINYVMINDTSLKIEVDPYNKLFRWVGWGITSLWKSKEDCFEEFISFYNRYNKLDIIQFNGRSHGTTSKDLYEFHVDGEKYFVKKRDGAWYICNAVNEEFLNYYSSAQQAANALDNMLEKQALANKLQMALIPIKLSNGIESKVYDRPGEIIHQFSLNEKEFALLFIKGKHDAWGTGNRTFSSKEDALKVVEEYFKEQSVEEKKEFKLFGKIEPETTKNHSGHYYFTLKNHQCVSVTKLNDKWKYYVNSSIGSNLIWNTKEEALEAMEEAIRLHCPHLLKFIDGPMLEREVTHMEPLKIPGTDIELEWIKTATSWMYSKKVNDFEFIISPAVHGGYSVVIHQTMTIDGKSKQYIADNKLSDSLQEAALHIMSFIKSNPAEFIKDLTKWDLPKTLKLPDLDVELKLETSHDHRLYHAKVNDIDIEISADKNQLISSINHSRIIVTNLDFVKFHDALNNAAKALSHELKTKYPFKFIKELKIPNYDFELISNGEDKFTASFWNPKQDCSDVLSIVYMKIDSGLGYYNGHYELHSSVKGLVWRCSKLDDCVKAVENYIDQEYNETGESEMKFMTKEPEIFEQKKQKLIEQGAFKLEEKLLEDMKSAFDEGDYSGVAEMAFDKLNYLRQQHDIPKEKLPAVNLLLHKQSPFSKLFFERLYDSMFREQKSNIDLFNKVRGDSFFIDKITLDNDVVWILGNGQDKQVRLFRDLDGTCKWRFDDGSESTEKFTCLSDAKEDLENYIEEERPDIMEFLGLRKKMEYKLNEKQLKLIEKTLRNADTFISSDQIALGELISLIDDVRKDIVSSLIVGDGDSEECAAIISSLRENYDIFDQLLIRQNLAIALINKSNKTTSITEEKKESSSALEEDFVKKGEISNSKPSFSQSLKSDATNAGYRIASNQATSLIKNTLIALAKSKGQDANSITILSAFLDSEYGKAMISLIVGYGLLHAPSIKDDSRIQKLSEEFRVEGMATIGNEVISNIFELIAPVVANTVSNIPEEKIRVQSSEEEELLEQEEINNLTTEH